MNQIVIVDDHPAFRAWARAVLAADGFRVVGEAVDGASALAEVQAVRPDVVLLDVQLPDADGFEVADALRAAQRLPRDGSPPSPSYEDDRVRPPRQHAADPSHPARWEFSQTSRHFLAGK